MSFEMHQDQDKGVAVIEVDGHFSSDDARRFAREFKAFPEDCAKHQLLVDLENTIGFTDTAARQETARQIRPLDLRQMAVVNAKPSTRIMIMILVKLAGGDLKARFFSTYEDAMQWLEKTR